MVDWQGPTSRNSVSESWLVNVPVQRFVLSRTRTTTQNPTKKSPGTVLFKRLTMEVILASYPSRYSPSWYFLQNESNQAMTFWQLSSLLFFCILSIIMSVQIRLLRLRPVWARLDTTPYIIAYAALLYWQLGLEDVPENQMPFVYARLALIGIAFTHSLTYLSSYWSPHMRAHIQYFSGGSKITVSLLQKYSFIKAYHKKPSGSFCDILRIKHENDIYYFHFMENKYIYDEQAHTFYRLKPNMHFDITSIPPAQQSQLFEHNSLSIPMKKFNEILREQLMEPFSFFQIFSISLWMLDGNVLYTLFTLGLLFMTGCTVGIQRMRTMMTLRQMKLNPQIITVFRGKKWTKISSEDLKPGDICLLQTADSTKSFAKDEPKVAPRPQLPGQVLLTEEEQFLKDQVPFNKYLPAKLFKTENMNTDSFRCLPCDMLLLNGSVVVNEAMLTGESVPQVKDSIESIRHSELLDIKARHKSNVLFCGTEIIQVQGNTSYPKNIDGPQAPHCLGMVLRTGFDTAKGKLIRTVFYNNENANLRQTDGLVIVLVLLVFALLSSARVLYFGLEDDTRDKNKLFLRCILIVTTVVPPELPMILSIAVNQSLLFLQMRKIFCTEPYRIPWAGKVTLLAFDKTGTLTNDHLKFLGIVDDNTLNLKTRTNCGLETQSVLAGCQSLVYAENKLQGDPIELLYLEGNTHWSYQAQLKIANNNHAKRELQVRAWFPFKSDLKRMSTLVIQDEGKQRVLKLLTKGAPESLQPLLKEVPENFVAQYEHFANKGYRVLCLADKLIDESEYGFEEGMFFTEKATIVANRDRVELEQQLTFRGLLICESPLKKDTASWISKFTASYFVPLIITGDNLLTAIAVATQLGLGSNRKPAVIEFKNGSYTLHSDKQVHGTSTKDDLVRQVKQWSEQFMLCMPSDTLYSLEGHRQLSQILAQVRVFARTSPKQKEQIIMKLKEGGFGVLMCGDGTNDVGALKKAHVGIALVTKHEVDGKEEEEEDDDALDQMSFQQQMQRARVQREEMQKKMAAAKGNRDQIKSLAQQQMAQATSEMFDMGQSYKFGDACIAAPFTSKMSTSIRCVHTILKQGVCTLVTTIQTYKIMALLSLINAYSMSSLHMQALKLSETQMTIMGILGAGYYFCYSSAKPQRSLSKIKPSFTIFEWPFLLSLVLQITLHITTMDYAIHHIGMHYSTAMELAVDHDAEFKPTFLNTVVFILQLLQQSCIFLFNHPGEPHMQRLDVKSKFFKALVIPLGLSVVCALNISEELNNMLELKFPENDTNNAALEFGSLCVFIVVVNYLIERAMKWLKYGQCFGYI